MDSELQSVIDKLKFSIETPQFLLFKSLTHLKDAVETLKKGLAKGKHYDFDESNLLLVVTNSVFNSETPQRLFNQYEVSKLKAESVTQANRLLDKFESSSSEFVSVYVKTKNLDVTYKLTYGKKTGKITFLNTNTNQNQAIEDFVTKNDFDGNFNETRMWLTESIHIEEPSTPEELKSVLEDLGLSRIESITLKK